MDEQTGDQDIELGLRLRQVRRSRNRTIKEVAGVAGVSPSLVSQIERGRATPSLATLRRMASALDVSVSALFMESGHSSASDVDPRGKQLVVRKRDRQWLRTHHYNVEVGLLTPDGEGLLEFLQFRVLPGAGVPEEPSGFAVHEGEECSLVLSNSIVYIIEGREYPLHAGDSIRFDAAIPHRVENRFDEPAEFISVTTPPRPRQ